MEALVLGALTILSGGLIAATTADTGSNSNDGPTSCHIVPPDTDTSSHSSYPGPK